MQLPPEKAFENAKQEEKTRDFNIIFTKLSREDAKQLELSIFHRLPYDLKIRYCEGLDKVSNLPTKHGKKLMNILAPMRTATQSSYSRWAKGALVRCLLWATRFAAVAVSPLKQRD